MLLNLEQEWQSSVNAWFVRNFYKVKSVKLMVITRKVSDWDLVLLVGKKPHHHEAFLVMSIWHGAAADGMISRL
jgi:hypothetical protein